MATRIQGLILGLGKAKQSAFGTASASYIRFRKLDNDITSALFNAESDAGEIGKGDEFAGVVYPVSKDFSTRIEKYGTAEFTTWAWAYGLSGVTELAGTYTLTPLDPATTLDVKTFSTVAQLAEGGGFAVNNLYYDCAVEEVNFAFNYGPGRQSTKCTASIVGSGKVLTPSAVTVPTLTTEHHMLSGSMSLTINGVDYIAAKSMLSGNIGWKNNLMLDQGYFPGSGTQDGASIRGRMEYGLRQITMDFEARLASTSTEYATLKALTSGAASVSVQFDSTHTVTWTFAKVQFRAVTNSDVNGLATVKVVVDPISDGTNPVVSVSAQCGITGIAQ